MKGDYLRYIAEYKKGEDLEKVKQESLETYKKA